jgi:hypothetical protein
VSRQIALAEHGSFLGQHAPIFREVCFPAVMLHLALDGFDQTFLFAKDSKFINPWRKQRRMVVIPDISRQLTTGLTEPSKTICSWFQWRAGGTVGHAVFTI